MPPVVSQPRPMLPEGRYFGRVTLKWPTKTFFQFFSFILVRAHRTFHRCCCLAKSHPKSNIQTIAISLASCGCLSVYSACKRANNSVKHHPYLAMPHPDVSSLLIEASFRLATPLPFSFSPERYRDPKTSFSKIG